MLVNRETFILSMLLLATAATALVAWPGGSEQSLLISVSTIAIAAFKMRLIAYEFMEVRTAPLILRIFITVWLVAVPLTLVALYQWKPF
ncbi:cytochrome C oxidase subunit IV family protein [Sphingobium sp. AN558]|uniref:cytochrome C oxidase subunit IV family protein n=1 Tax=Sphingobium sp. AN558 TaxID=3133442 RepID=UPI0030BE5D10